MKRIFTLVLFVFGYLLALTVQAQQATNILFSHNGSPTSLTASWTGTGGNKLVVFYANGGAFVPVNGTNYTADVNQNYTAANDKDSGAGEAKIVYSGTANSTTINGLSGNTFYTVKVFEFTGTNYTTSNSTNNPAIVWYHANSAATASYAVPAGVTSATVQVWGAGGGTGNSSGANRSASGGGGGAYASAVLTSLSGSYTITAPLGGAGTSSNAAGGNGPASSFGALLIANGGSGSTGDSGAAGGATGATGTIKFAGGAGGDRVTGGAGGGGGGGGSAGATGAGGTGSDASGANGGAAGAAGAGGGAEGGAGGTNAGATTGGNGNFPGGGGGGQGNGGTTSGSGAGGLVIVSYIPTDGTQPAAFTTGSVTSAGGTVTAGYWNSSNTSLQVVVPLTAADASLDGGSIQIQIENTTNTGYVSIPASGLSNITTVDRLAGTKTITISAANLVAATGAGSTGFLNGASHHLTAIVTDAFGNATTGAASATPALTVVDLTAPTVSSIVRKTPLSPYTQATSVTFTVTFAESVSGVDATDFTKTISGITAGAITVNAVSATVYDVDVAGISTTEGTLRLDVNASASITDNAGNSFGPVYNTGETYTFDYTNPAQPANYNAVTLSGNVVANYWNSHNTGVRLAIAVPNDNSLVGGNIVVEARISSGTFTTIATSGSSTIATANTTQNIDIDAAAIAAITGYAQGVSLQFQVKFVDFVGQSGTFRQSTNSLVVDTVKPSITGNPSYSDGGGGKESITISFSETIALTNNAVPVNTSTNGNPGFYSAQPQINNGGGTKYITGSNTIVLESNNNGEWTAPLNITYTSNVGVAGNYVRDAAGNEMTTVTISTNAPAPTLASSMVLDPNGAGNEIITFTTDIALNTPTTANAVTGITVDADGPGAGAAVSVSGTYNSVGNVITLNSSTNNQWSSVTTVYYSGGNLASSSGTAMAAFGPEPILLGPVTIASNNAVNTARAKIGDIVTLSFTANSTLSATPVVVIDGVSATVSGSNPYTATITTTVSNNTGVFTWSIIAAQTSRSTEVKKTTNGSTVTFDKTDPTFTSLTIASNGITTTYAKPGNNVVVTFTVSENLNALPTATIDGKTATVVNTSGLNYTATVTTDNTYNNGTLPFSINIVDLAGNTGTGTAVTSGTGVTFDKTPPVVTSIAVSSTTKGFGNSQGIVPVSPTFEVSFLVTFTESSTGIDLNGADFTVLKDATVSYNPTLSVTGSGSTRTVTISGISGLGRISLGLADDDTILDAAGNPLGGVGAGNGSVAASYTGTQYYTIVLPEPANGVVSLTAPTVTSSSITVQWDQPLAGAQAATHYLVMGKPSSGSYSPLIPTDGTYVADAPLIQNIVKGAGIQTATFNVSSGTSYDFIIYPYTWSTNYNDVNHDNIDFKTPSTAFVNGVVTSSASVSALLLSSTPVSIRSIKNASGNSKAVMKFTIYDDGLDPISPNVMSLQLNGASQETITFTLRDQLPSVSEGGNVTGFTSSNGIIATAVYSGKGTTNTITLTNTTPGSWDASTTISYSGNGNVQFATLGKMQAINAHAVVAGADVVFLTNSSGSFIVPAGVTKIQVEAWGGGGAGGGYSQSAPYNNASSYGGGGGAYSRSLVTVTPGNSYSYTVGAGGQPTISTTNCCDFGQNGLSTTFGGSLVIAQGGYGALSSAYPTLGYGFLTGTFNQGGQATNGTGDVKFSGGNGGFGSDISPNPGGGGGSSAGITANGNPGINSYASPTTCSGCGIAGGVAPSGGGTGGAGFQSTNGGNGSLPGGGGGGVGSTFSSGAGATGQIRITYSSPSLTGTSDWDADNSPFKFSQLIITQGTGNDLSDWRDIIAGAELTDADSTHIVTGTVNPADGSSIIFSSIPSTLSTDLGYVPDAVTTSPKTYTLKIWLKNNLNTALASTIDGLSLAFKVDPTIAANLTYDDVTNSNQKSSRLVVATPAIESGANTIDVVASKLVYNTPGTSSINTNPQSQIGVGVPFSANGAGQDPEVYALDANNNLDLGYNNSANVTNPLQTFGQSVTSGNFSSGKLLLNPFYFNTGSSTLANTRIVVTGTGSPVVTAATSTDVWPRISNLTTIATGAGTEPALISSLTNTLVSASANFDFTISDDLGANGSTFADNDALPTLINQIIISQGTGNDGVLGDWTKSIAGAELTLTRRNGTPVGPTSVTSLASDVVIGATSISFSNIPFALTTSPGRISDGGANVYTLKIYLKSAIDPTITDLIDGKDFVFEASNTNTTIGGAANTSSVLATSTINSGDGLNTVAVVATKLDFISQWTAGATQSYDTPLDADAVTAGVQSPTAKARDVNGNLDLGFNAAVSAVTNAPATYPLASSTVTVNNGLLTFDPALKVTSAGGGTNGGTTNLIISSTGLTNGTSNSFALNYSPNSDVIADAGFSHPANIPYANVNNQVTDITPGTGVALEQFTVRDGGGSADADGTATKVSSVVLNINNYQLLRRVALYDGSTEVADLIVGAPNITVNSATNADMTFSGLTFVVPDDDFTTRKLTIKASFVSTAIAGFDNSIIEFKVKNIAASAISSSFIAGASTAFPTLGTDENKIEVVATRIDFITQPTTASVSVPMAPQIVVAARDANGNLDTDFTGAITGTGNTPVVVGNTFTTANDPAIGALFGAVNAGQLTYPSNFQFTVGDGDVRLTINAGSISGTSAIISSVTSYDSWLYFDPTFTYTTKIDFVNKQEDPVTATSQALGRLILRDGGSDFSATTFDLDGSFTRINSFTISLTNFQNIKKIALYAADGVTKIGSDQNAAATVTFTGLGSSAYQAPDNGTYTFYIRASFNETVTDLDQITMQVTAVSHNSGSKFAEQMPVSPPATVGGVDGATSFGDSSPTSVNILDVIATSLDFTHQASPAYAGINEPIGTIAPSFTVPYVSAPLPSTDAAIVSARDKFANLDTEFNATPTITQTAGPNSSITAPRNFVSGILRLDGMRYNTPGDGTLKVVAGGINSSAPSSVNSIPGDLVNVVHVTASLPDAGSGIITPTAGSNPPSYSMKGGSQGQSIFGVKFTTEGATSTEPTVNKFSFKFDVPYENASRTIFSNFKIKRGGADITSGISLTKLSSTNNGNFDIITVDISSDPGQLFAIPNQTLTYLLVADVDPSASLSTPAITPMFIDGGYGSATDENIIVTKGTASGIFNGNKYTFASTKPPVLRTAKGTQTSPYAGQLNVDPTLTSITLEFDTKVSSLDGGLNNGAELYSRTTNTKVANLVAPLAAGNYLFTNDTKNVISPLKYDIQFVNGNTFVADEVYYVIIKKGSFDQLTQKGDGIADEGLNFFGGISSNSTLYFKISSDKPIILSESKSTLYSNKVGSVSTKFDQFGTAYYLIVHSSSPAPTHYSQVKDPSTYTASTKYAYGSYPINQINTLQTNTFASITNFVAGQTYHVYIYAENDAQNNGVSSPVSAGGIYIPAVLPATGYTTGTGQPTLTVALPAFSPAYTPVYLICPNSYVTVTEPIILDEATTSFFSSGTASPGNLQDFNLLLPSGYEFDPSSSPDVQLIGADFNSQAASLSYVSNSVLKVSYRNYGSASKDYIVISNLRVKGASGSSTLSIQRFYGNNTSFASPTAAVASIGIVNSKTFNFTNSYSKDNSDHIKFPPTGLFPDGSPSTVTAIPDNYVDLDSTINGSIRLLPSIDVPNDYNASIFTGTGVTNDLLTLSAVSKDAPFNITMNHTDPNGCVSQVITQYLIYNHVSPITRKLGTSNSTVNPPGTAQALVNNNFPGVSNPILPAAPLFHNELASYELLSLTADLPASVLKDSTSQIISGKKWRTQVQNFLVQQPDSVYVPPYRFYYNYTWDYSKILNAPIGGSIEMNPYFGNNRNKFDAETSKRNTYYKGGSLGKVQFTGLFQSMADLQVVIPFRQEVELFVPALPIIEIGSSNQSFTDTNDGTLNTLDSKKPEQHINTFQYKNGYEGTPIFCEAGGTVTLNGFPVSSAGTSSGKFALYDYTSFNFSSGTGIQLLASAPNSDFVDNGNGSATINPQNGSIKNGYKDILVAYTYQENNSPAVATGYLIIRVAPNPISVINYTSAIGPNTPSGNVFCEQTDINFNASSSSITSGVIEHYVWNFNDQTNSTGTNPNIDSAMVSKHKFIQPAAYTISLTTTSDVGCVSAPKTSPLKVGSIPTVAFQFKGVSVDEGITFNNKSSIASASIIGLGDGFAKVDWNYGDNTPINSVTTAPFVNTDIIHKYATAGLNHVNVKITSLLGCVNTRTSDIIVLSNEKPTPIASYLETFETSNGKWQPSSLPITSSSKNPASWLIGAPSNPVIKIDPAINEGKFVKTGAVSYNPSERSAFYSPVFDLSQLNRPMVSFNSFFQLETSDGVVLEYSIDPKNVADSTKEWFALGQPGEGVEWFTDRGIAAKPGNQIGNDYGWSQATITKWVESKHLLDVAAKAPRIVFRFALASVKSPAVDGFAFDNFRVGERTRTILMENFTTTNGKDAAQNSLTVVENDFINTKFQKDDTGTTIVKMNYHIGFTQPDPFNIDYPADPSARALYYNVKDVPYAMLDGARPDGATNLSTWGNAAYDAQTLQLGRAEIVVPTPAVNTDGSIKFDVKVTAKVDLPENTILHVAVIEQAILQSALSTEQKALIKTGENSFTYVLKQMLPNALGTRLGAKLLNGQTKTLEDFEYYPDPVRLYANADDLAIIVFLQNEDTKEVYQTAYVKGISDPPTVTGLEDGLRIEDVTLYPNPADQEINILLPRKAIGDVEIQLFDQMGKSVANSTIKTGEQKGTLNVRDLAASMYLMRLTENGVMTMKKVVVVHQN